MGTQMAPPLTPSRKEHSTRWGRGADERFGRHDRHRFHTEALDPVGEIGKWLDQFVQYELDQLTGDSSAQSD
ncbi:hypothetical protein DJ84_00855 [Halorubrum ezzemoulense]|nr:hypothetical protein DJ84_00855 [Halorubrum ezzemoulense]